MNTNLNHRINLLVISSLIILSSGCSLSLPSGSLGFGDPSSEEVIKLYFSGTVTKEDDGAPLEGATVSLQRQITYEENETEYRSIETVVSDSQGRFQLSISSAACHPELYFWARKDTDSLEYVSEYYPIDCDSSRVPVNITVKSKTIAP